MQIRCSGDRGGAAANTESPQPTRRQLFKGLTTGTVVLGALSPSVDGEETLNLMVLKPQPERVATIRRMAALPGSGVRPDQVLAITQAFGKLFGDGDHDGAYKHTDIPAVQPRR
jgi:hypothetical protein